MTDLTIVVVNFNTKDLTLECINSIFKSNTRNSYEIVVVENGSTDGSKEALSKLKNKVRLIDNKTNLGFAKANNQGIKARVGKSVLLLNSDTKVKKGSIDTLIEFSQSVSDAGAVGARLLDPDGSIQPSAFRLPTILRAIEEYWLGKKAVSQKYIPAGNTPQQVEALVMAAMLLTPVCLDKVGLLDEKYFMYFEDIDYCKRINESGLKIYYLPTSLVTHYHGASGKNLASRENQWRRLIPSSKIYHGIVGHYIYNFILWSGQKCQKLLRKK